MLLKHISSGETSKDSNLSNRSDIDEKGLIRRAGELAEEVQEVPQARRTTHKKRDSLQIDK